MPSIISFVIILILPILFIGVGYYFDYKHNRPDFLKTLKSVALGIATVAVGYFALSFTGEWIANLFPWDQNYGKNYNEARQKAGVPLIEESWKLAAHNGNNFEQWWMDSLNTDNNYHTIKIIKFDLLGPTSELDYFSSDQSNFRLKVAYNYNNRIIRFSKITHAEAAKINQVGYTQALSDETEIPITRNDFNKIIASWK